MALNQAIEITPDQQDTLVSLLSGHLPNTEAWIYGSRVRGTSRPASDLDMVVFATPEQARGVSELRESFEESNLPFRVDLFVWDEIPESFREQIEREHVVLTKPWRYNIADKEWKTLPFPDVVFFQEGPGIRNWQYRDEGIPFLNIRCLINGRLNRAAMNCLDPQEVEAKYRHFLLDAGDYVVSSSGTIGRIAEVRHEDLPCMLNTSVIRMRPRDRNLLDRRFLRYFLASSAFQDQIRSYASGSVQVNYGPTHLKQMKIVVPPMPEQRAIAHILGTLDDKIETNRRMNKTLEAMARAIFKDWFVDFGPTRAKAEGRARYLASELWDLFPDALDDEGKPVGWMVSKIGKEVQAVGGGTPSTKEPSYWAGGEHHWATPKDLSKLTSPVLLGTDRKITDSGVHKISSGLLPVGTVLLSSRAPIGYLAIAEVPTAINQGFIAMVCQKRLPNTFVLFWCHENLDYIKDISGGSTFAEISKRAFRPVPVVVPSGQILVAYDRLIRPLYFRIVANTKENETLARTRDLLLPKLMSGEIRLRDAEKVIEAVA